MHHMFLWPWGVLVVIYSRRGNKLSFINHICTADVAVQRQAAARVDPQLMRHAPLEYDPEYLNPCWDDDGTLSCLPVSLRGTPVTR